MPKQRIGIIGHLGGGKLFLDGQTVKTKILYKELSACGYKNIVCVDTYYNNTNKAKLLLDSVLCILRCQTIIILLSGNGMKIYFPMMYWAKKILHRRVFHDVIGGNLADYVDRYPKYRKYLNSFDGNWVEFLKLKNELENRGITNCMVVPNFKRLAVSDAKLEITRGGQRTFCIFSRVMEEKGVTEAILAIEKYNSEYNEKAFLNIWGPIDDRYKEDFECLLKKHEPYVTYHGCIDYDKSVEVLTDHVALLFPTHWQGEGFPGTIVDSYAAAVPVIASDWNANAELVDNFKTGWVYPNKKINSLYESIIWAMEHKEEMIKMRKNCRDEAKKYMPEKQMDKIRIALIGATGGGQTTSSGQIIRTRILLRELQKRYGEGAIIVCNTSLIGSNPLRFAKDFIGVLNCRRIMVILSQNGMKRIWPILSFMARYANREIYNNVIGGNLPELVKSYPCLASYMKNFKINWVQMVSMQEALLKYGITNTEWLPNSKPLNILNLSEREMPQEYPFRFCTFSRVSLAKGIERAIKAIKEVNDQSGKTVATLDIYGKPDDEYEKRFGEVLKSAPKYVQYRGVIPFDQSVKALKQYYMLLIVELLEV